MSCIIQFITFVFGPCISQSEVKALCYSSCSYLRVPEFHVSLLLFVDIAMLSPPSVYLPLIVTLCRVLLCKYYSERLFPLTLLTNVPEYIPSLSITRSPGLAGLFEFKTVSKYQTGRHMFPLHSDPPDGDTQISASTCFPGVLPSGTAVGFGVGVTVICGAGVTVAVGSGVGGAVVGQPLL